MSAKFTLKNTFITPHAKEKMKYYRITEKQIFKILNYPQKMADSKIVENAKDYCRQFGKNKEIFVLMKYEKQKPTVISTWIYFKSQKSN